MLRIAQVGPLWERIPPQTYGGTERVVHSLTEELTTQGHHVTLFACGESQTKATLVAVYPRPLYRDHIPWTNIMYPLLHYSAVLEQAANFDIIHIHLNKASDYLSLPLFAPLQSKTVFTLHFPYPTAQGRTDRHLVLQKYKMHNFISISNNQRRGGENLKWLGTVHNGIDLSPYTFSATPRDYFFWLGKFNPDKGVVEAIQAAQQAKVTLILGGSIDNLDHTDRQYYEQHVKPLIDGRQIQYVGELTDAQKNKYFGGAKAFLNPLQWEEPFGLTMAESLACGTPVIAFARGAAPEIITEGQTGFLVHKVNAMAQRIAEVDTLDRAACRQRAEQHFTASVMTQAYYALYEKVLNNTL